MKGRMRMGDWRNEEKGGAKSERENGEWRNADEGGANEDGRRANGEMQTGEGRMRMEK